MNRSVGYCTDPGIRRREPIDPSSPDKNARRELEIVSERELVCVCVRERERDSMRKRERKRESERKRDRDRDR